MAESTSIADDKPPAAPNPDGKPSPSSPPPIQSQPGPDEQPKQPTRPGARNARYGNVVQVFRCIPLFLWLALTCIWILLIQTICYPIRFVHEPAYDKVIGKTKESFCLFMVALTQVAAPTFVRVSGDRTVADEIALDAAGNVTLAFPDRTILIANHLVYSDWIYLWWSQYMAGLHGSVCIVLKESLKRIPVIGQGMSFFGFIFMARKWASDKITVANGLKKLKQPIPINIHHPHHHNRVPEKRTPLYPKTAVMIFPEGTNFSRNSHQKSAEFARKTGLPDFKHVLMPRSTGLHFIVSQLKDTVPYIYDCTIGYEGQPKSSNPDEVYTLRAMFLRGLTPRVHMHWRRHAIADIPTDDAEEFGAWLRVIYAQKDEMVGQFLERGEFPPTDDASKYYDTTIRLRNWWEAFKIYIPW